MACYQGFGTVKAAVRGLALAVLIFVGHVRHSNACSCVDREYCLATSSADLVVSGLILDRVEDEGSETVFGKYVYTLDVDQFYKTPTDMTVSQQFTFTSPTSPATCGMYLEIGTEYVVGVYLKPDGSFMAYTCGATLLWDQVTPEQLAVLEDGGDCPPPETCAELVCPDDQECVLNEDDEAVCGDKCGEESCQAWEVCELIPVVCVVPPCDDSPVAQCVYISENDVDMDLSYSYF